MTTIPPTPKHPGGRPPKDPSDKVIKCHISMTSAHHAETKGDRAGMIRRALELKAKVEDRVAFCLWYYAQAQPLSAHTVLDYFNPPYGDHTTP